MAWISRRAGVVGVGLVHALLVVALLSDPAEIADKPIRNIDHAPHFYAALHAADHLRTCGALWGYDPFWMAGYPEGHVSLIDNKLFCALLLVTPPRWKILSFNLGVLAVLAAVPWLAAAASRAGGGTHEEAAGAALAATIGTFSVPASVIFWCWGGISFFFAAVLAVPVTIGLSVALTEESLFSRRGVTTLLGAIFAVFTHPFAAPIIALGLLPVAWCGPRPIARRLRDLLILGALMALPLVPISEANLWLRGPLRPTSPPGYGDPFFGGLQQLRLDWWTHLLGGASLFYGAGALLVILPLAAYGSLCARRGTAVPAEARTRVVEQVILAELVGCAAIAYVAPSLVARFGLLQPYRLLIPLCFFACVAAGRGIARGANRVAQRRLAAWAVAALAVLVIGNAVRGRTPLLVLGYGNDAAESELATFLERSTTVDDRILVESTPTQLPVPGRLGRVIVVRRFALLPLLVERELLGYIGTAPFLAHRYASFEGGTLFGKSLATLSETEFATLLSRYAVSWVVACTADALAGVSRFTAVVEEVEPAADCRIFRVRHPDRSRFLEGSGEVQATLDRIEVKQAAGDRIILKYHWMPGLRTDPPLPIEEARRPGVPVGFIAIRPGTTTDFTIRPRGAVERVISLVATGADREADARAR
jgi:hypothetical protein